jgi:dihydropteroate synthase
MTDASAKTNRPEPPRWAVRGRVLTCEGPPLFMGIVNATPDSFSDGGQWFAAPAALERALQLVSEGADIIDIGGESSRPGARGVAVAEELRRVVPVIGELAGQSSVLISIDTTKAEVARAALSAGAHIVNDISGLTFDSEMKRVCADSAAGVICMHMQGTPETMQADPRYDDVVREVRDYLVARLDDLEQHGIPRERVALDPGIGFGKSAEHNVELLSHVGALRAAGRPVCIGHSRKRFLKRLLGREIDERLFATVGVAVAVALQKAEIIRVHDIAPVRDAVLACRALVPDF